jgi:hypothetical protein
MPRRVSLPGAAELFRSTPAQHSDPIAAEPGTETDPGPSAAPAAEQPNGATSAATGGPRGSGRVRHDEKITVYVSNDELLDLERARLALRADHGMAVDRGRIVREALALAIGDLAERGADSDLVRRLSQP